VGDSTQFFDDGGTMRGNRFDQNISFFTRFWSKVKGFRSHAKAHRTLTWSSP